MLAGTVVTQHDGVELIGAASRAKALALLQARATTLIHEEIGNGNA